MPSINVGISEKLAISIWFIDAMSANNLSRWWALTPDKIYVNQMIISNKMQNKALIQEHGIPLPRPALYGR